MAMADGHLYQQDEEREQGEGLTGPGDPEGSPGQQCPPAPGGYLASLEGGQQADQAPQVAVGLEHDRAGSDHGRRVDGDHGAGHRRAQDGAVAHEPPDQDNVDGLDGDCHVAGDGQGPGRAKQVRKQGHGRKEQGHPGRLVEDKVPVGQRPAGQAQGGTKPNAVVVLQDVVRPSRPEQLENAQPEGDQGQEGDGRAPARPHPSGPGAAQAAAAGQAYGAILHEMGTLPRPRAAAGEASA